MHLGLVLELATSTMADRVALSTDQGSWTYQELQRSAQAASAHFAAHGVPSVVSIGNNHAAAPIALFGAAGIDVPYIPLNYRLGPAPLAAQLREHPGAFVLYQDRPPVELAPDRSAERQAFLDTLDGMPASPPPVGPPPTDPDLPCVLLYTSGTTAAPKAAVLRHRHLMAYVLGTGELASAPEADASLVSVPPYHVAGLVNLLSNLYAGRRIVLLDRFDPQRWLSTVRQEHVTHAMVVPTMLARIVEQLDGASGAGTPSLRTLSYGGARMPLPVLRRALALFPTTGFVNAYGLTETASTIALLGPEDHRAALDPADPGAARRLESVGKLLPGIELEVRDEGGAALGPGQSGLLFLRGEQVSGEYTGGSDLDAAGWFPTRDRGWVDEEGYLFVEGRADDTIIRGGENIAPSEIEDVLIGHPDVVDAVVVGLPDQEWGQRVAAVVVPSPGRPPPDAAALQAWARGRLRSSKTPETIEIWPELPRTDTGKLLRRRVVAALAGSISPAAG